MLCGQTASCKRRTHLILGKCRELLPDLLNAGALVLPLDLLLKVADHEVLALLDTAAKRGNQT